MDKATAIAALGAQTAAALRARGFDRNALRAAICEAVVNFGFGEDEEAIFRTATRKQRLKG